MGVPQEIRWGGCIEEQLTYFANAKMPFCWYEDEESNPQFKQNLLDRGFTNGGVFQGVIGSLDKPLPPVVVPKEYILERVEDEVALEAFNDLVCEVFALQGITKEMFKQVNWNAMKNKDHPMFHWIARKEGKVVAAVSTLIQGQMVSFWNGATHPEYRKQGLSTALRCLALQDAISKGCRLGASYLMAF
jgi:predicted GNAT family acetyltransferase